MLVRQWNSNDVYSYGFLIPFISLYLVWIRRDCLKEITPCPNHLAGLAFLVIGLSMLILGHAGSIGVIQEISIVFTASGIVLFFLGTSFFRILWFPTVYLLFMIPFWNIFTDPLQSVFQNMTAKIASTIIQFFPIPVYRDGIFLILPEITLEVAKVCSGINYLIAVIAIGVPLAYLYLESWIKKLILISSAVLLSILANGLRVALIGLFSYYGISGTLHGPGHVFQALSVSIIGYIVLFIGVRILSGKSDYLPYRSQSATDRDIQVVEYEELDVKKTQIFYISLIAIIFLLAGGYIHFYEPSRISIKKNFDLFPERIGHWSGYRTQTELNIYREIGFDRTLNRHYRSASGEDVNLFIGYFERQGQGKEIVGYKTRALHNNASKLKVQIDADRSVEINKSVQKYGKKSHLMLFWYEINGRIVANRYLAKVYAVLDFLVRGRTNGALVLLSSEIQEDDPERTYDAEKDLLIHLVPLLSDHLPS